MPNMSTQQNLIDLDRALLGVDGDRELLRELAGICREDIPGLTDQLRQETAAGDLVEVERIAHKLKGLCSMFHSTAHRAQAEEVETLARTGRREDLDHAVSRLCTTSEAIAKQLLDI